jgi:hypothetical protein
MDRVKKLGGEQEAVQIEVRLQLEDLDWCTESLGRQGLPCPLRQVNTRVMLP